MGGWVLVAPGRRGLARQEGLVWVEEDRALAVAGELARRRVSCRLQRIAGAAAGYTVVVELEEGRQAWWDLHGDGLEARVLRGGVLLGFVALPVAARHPVLRWRG